RRQREHVHGERDEEDQHRDQRGHALFRDHSVDLRGGLWVWGFRACARRLGIRARNTIPPMRLTPTATRYVPNWSANALARSSPRGPKSRMPARSRPPIPFIEMGRETITASNGTKRKK